MSNKQNNKVTINCSNIENSALHWNFLDKILNKIDEVEATENICRENLEKAGFIYLFDSKSTESKQLFHIEIPLISDNEYLCSLSKLFSSPLCNDLRLNGSAKEVNSNENVSYKTQEKPVEDQSTSELKSDTNEIRDDTKEKTVTSQESRETEHVDSN